MSLPERRLLILLSFVLTSFSSPDRYVHVWAAAAEDSAAKMGGRDAGH